MFHYAATKYPATWYPTRMNPTVISTALVAKASPQETAAGAPDTERDQYGGQREHLPDFDADIEANDIRHQSVLREIQLLELGGQAESVKQAKDQHGNFGIGLEPEESPEAVHVVERFIDHRKTDDRIDDIGVRVESAENAGQQRDAVPQGEEADVLNDVFEPV